MIETYVGMIKVVLVMLGIVAGIYALSRYSGKLKFRFRPQNGGCSLKKVDSIYLGYKKIGSVVEVQDHILVIGAGDKEISLLAKWKKEDKKP